MERGKPDLTVYSFELPQGQDMPYPDDELWTLDYREADAYAREKGYLLIGQDLQMDDSDLIEDYTPVKRCKVCDGELERNGVDEGYVHSDDADDTHVPETP